MEKHIIFLLVVFLLSCSTSYHNSAEYNRVWNATRRVLERHNLNVRPSLYREGTLVAVSRVNGEFLNKTRVKVVARVEPGEEGYLEPSIKVLNQWDNSDAVLRRQPSYQTGHRWLNFSANAAMEAQLYNEIQRELGNYNTYNGKAWKPIPKTARRPYPDYVPAVTPANSEKKLQEVRE